MLSKMDEITSLSTIPRSMNSPWDYGSSFCIVRAEKVPISG